MCGIGMMDYWIARFLFDLCTYFIVFVLFGSLFFPFFRYTFELVMFSLILTFHFQLQYKVFFLLFIVRRIERRGSKDDATT